MKFSSFLKILTPIVIVGLLSSVFFLKKNFTVTEKVSAQGNGVVCPNDFTIEDGVELDFFGFGGHLAELNTPPLEVTLDNENASSMGNGYVTDFILNVEKGREIETLATELDVASVGSYIRSHLYTAEGDLLVSGDTRLSFKAPYTGEYHVIVTTFSCKEGRVAFRAYDKYLTSLQTRIHFRNDQGIIFEKGTELPSPVQVLLNQFRIVSFDKESKIY